MAEPANLRTWTLLTNHGHVLVHVHRNPDTRIRDIAAAVGITERATLNILRDLEEGGYLLRVPRGRRTHYEVNTKRPFRHPAESDHEVGEMLALFG
ncbi:MAG: winged helix-turn-helix transcriptional regulator [Candidatus Nanopelagicales bacterium]|nr:winged helix-turn-helix transcriptional regulator [Candidatus Nanopelagicales bacterium]